MSGTAARTPRDQLIELRQALRALAVQFAHVQVQYRGAGVVAIDGLLDLLVHRHGDVFREVRGHPFRAVRGGGDDYLVLILRVQRIVEKLHLIASIQL
ncbi:hypothetical protein QFZ96_007322 [Paraburkholderia youngii]